MCARVQTSIRVHVRAAARIRGSRKDRYRLSACCDSQRRGQRRRVIQREIVDAQQRHQRTSVTADLRASRCSPQRKIRALPEMRSTPSQNVNPWNPSSSNESDDLTSVILNQLNSRRTTNLEGGKKRTREILPIDFPTATS
jgi:hypothetical protein